MITILEGKYCLMFLPWTKKYGDPKQIGRIPCWQCQICNVETQKNVIPYYISWELFLTEWVYVCRMSVAIWSKYITSTENTPMLERNVNNVVAPIYELTLVHWTGSMPYWSNFFFSWRKYMYSKIIRDEHVWLVWLWLFLWPQCCVPYSWYALHSACPSLYDQ